MSNRTAAAAAPEAGVETPIVEAPIGDATIVDTYVATWNETDPARRRAGIARAWAESGSYRDPVMTSDGHAGVDAMPALSAAEGLAGVQARFPGFV